ncbi:MAG: hypothetical protein KJ023_00205 [Burkholderiaceae bacterium]|nr:hypothetical protein [Burkholderiaceae bacterium]
MGAQYIGHQRRVRVALGLEVAHLRAQLGRGQAKHRAQCAGAAVEAPRLGGIVGLLHAENRAPPHNTLVNRTRVGGRQCLDCMRHQRLLGPVTSTLGVQRQAPEHASVIASSMLRCAEFSQ